MSRELVDLRLQSVRGNVPSTLKPDPRNRKESGHERKEDSVQDQQGWYVPEWEHQAEQAGMLQDQGRGKDSRLSLCRASRLGAQEARSLGTTSAFLPAL